jgi:hypothetical protein
VTWTRARRRLWLGWALAQALVVLARPASAASVLLARSANPNAMTNDRGVDAVLAILGESAPETIVVWVTDVVTGRSLRRQTTFSLEGERSAEVLAIRAIEFLRASLLEVRLGVGELPPPPAVMTMPAASRQAEPPPPSPSQARWGFEAGGSMIAGFDGVGTALLPLLRVDRAFADWVGARLSLAGLGSRAHVDRAGESAEVTQQFALCEGALRLGRGHRVRPVLTLGAGLLHVTAEGRADWPYKGHSAVRWSFLFDVGTGVWLKIGGRYDVALELHVELAQPYPVVSFVGSESASLARPSLLLTLTLVGWL